MQSNMHSENKDGTASAWEELIDTVTADIAGKLKPSRYRHTMGVMYTAAALAMRWGADVHRAMAAGLLHDCGKYPSIDRQIEGCRAYGLAPDQWEMENPALIHARLGSCLAKERYGVKDEEIICAIRFHTTGRPDMTMLEKIIYIADYIEPHRRNIPLLETIREAAFTNIDEAVWMEADNTLRFLQESKKSIHPLTKDTRDFYKTKMKG